VQAGGVGVADQPAALLCLPACRFRLGQDGPGRAARLGQFLPDDGDQPIAVATHNG
jgi:hypothetical protein